MFLIISKASTTITITGTSFAASTADTRVVIGGEDCAVATATSTEITCSVGRLPVGDNSVKVYVENKGKAGTTLTVAGEKVASVSSPSASSVNGGAELIIGGNGFVNGDTTVDIGGLDCPVTSVNFGQVSSVGFFSCEDMIFIELEIEPFIPKILNS